MRRFILSLGVQKAATSWLYIQMFRQRNFKRPALKEMHVLDAIFLSDQLQFSGETETRFSDAMASEAKTCAERFDIRKYHMLLDRREYLRYYDELLDEPDCFSCDTTPSYAGLPEEALAFVRSGFSDLGIQTSVVFVLREPVSRIESAIRMRLRDAGTLEATTTEEIMGMIREEAGSASDRLRSSYRLTVDRIRSQFAPEQVFIGFFEDLFSERELQRLAQVTGLDPSRFEADKTVNETQGRIRYPRRFVEEIKARYEDEYAFAVDTLGLDRAIWDARTEELVEM